MLEFRCLSTGKTIEVNEIDAHWYNGHEDYKVIHAETAKTVEAEQTEPAQTQVKRKYTKR